MFHVHSVSGQLLYSKTIEAASGKNSFKLNTSTFTAGIYFYSIEYKGQRLIKRMSVQK
ncbi:MAG: T9SS type A sorting domain-containing protein [Bacteroidales bacterium]|nr:T9SS type A sorting domain-containing protein [Bacteroidales bacterium]